MGDLTILPKTKDLHKPIQLTIRNAERAQLISGIDRFKADCEAETEPDSDDATGAIALVLCAVFALPFIAGFVWGF